MKKPKKFIRVVIIIYIIYILFAIKGIISARDSVVPEKMSAMEIGHSLVKVMAYGSVETVSTFMILFPKETIAQTDTFIHVDDSNIKMSFMDISKLESLPSNEGYSAPGFEKMNYYFQAKTLAAINKKYDVNSRIPISTIIMPYYRKNKK